MVTTNEMKRPDKHSAIRLKNEAGQLQSAELNQRKEEKICSEKRRIYKNKRVIRL